MFRLAILFLVVALIAGIFGFGGIAHTAVGFSKIIFFVAIALAVVGFIMGGRGTSTMMLVGLLALPTLGAGAMRARSVGDVQGLETPVQSSAI